MVWLLCLHASMLGFESRSVQIFFFFFFFFQAVNRIPSRKNREMITSFYSQVSQFEQAAGRELQIKRDQELAAS